MHGGIVLLQSQAEQSGALHTQFAVRDQADTEYRVLPEGGTAEGKAQVSRMIIDVTEANFRREVSEAELPVLLEFYAAWCGRCAMMADVLAEFAEKNAGSVKVCRADIDRSPGLAEKFGVEKVPAFIAFRRGAAQRAAVGVVPYQALDEICGGHE